ncbi:hypothetical protein KCG43_20150 [Photobacterium sp. WH24]|uniref:hypothetical protein n=1 Tax=Photobacterium sp. WH24 TaxID=2827237 RepID=UPI001C453D51|nr:hypothetical protein [Photobacterium sp. WH24]MBV7264327.1 hypothetical protein [Photobacterium sp. WH24]
MSNIDELNQRLARYKKTEQEILEHGQRVTDEDDRELQRASLQQVQNTIGVLEKQIAIASRPAKRRTRQYPARV